MNKNTIVTLAAVVVLSNQVIPGRDETLHVHLEMHGEVSTDILRPSAAIIRQDVVVNLTGLVMTATLGRVEVHTH